MLITIYKTKQYFNKYVGTYFTINYCIVIVQMQKSKNTTNPRVNNS